MLAAAVLFCGTAAADRLSTAFVTDPLTGVAIGGYDPVSYFTEPEPLAGRPEFVVEWQGVPWYFASAANRDVFIRAPEVYAPQHGGHCEMGLARGYLSDGQPRLHAIRDARLYLFYSSANREAFLLSPEATVERAEANWPHLVRSILGADPPPVSPHYPRGVAGGHDGQAEPEHVDADAHPADGTTVKDHADASEPHAVEAVPAAHH